MPARPKEERLQILFDPEDSDLVLGSNWCLSNKYPSRRRGGKLEYLHILIAGVEEGKEVDHKNGDKLDVRRENLRQVPHVSNCQNANTLRSNNKSGFRGVSWNKRRGKWKASAVINYRQHHVGYFDLPEEADAAARAYRLEHMEGALG